MKTFLLISIVAFLAKGSLSNPVEETPLKFEEHLPSNSSTPENSSTSTLDLPTTSAPLVESTSLAPVNGSVLNISSTLAPNTTELPNLTLAPSTQVPDLTNSTEVPNLTTSTLAPSTLPPTTILAPVPTKKPVIIPSEHTKPFPPPSKSPAKGPTSVEDDLKEAMAAIEMAEKLG